MAGLTAAPVHADMMGNAFLRALTNAGVPFSQPDSTMALGQSVCPMLVAARRFVRRRRRRDGRRATGCPPRMAGVFTIVAIATYCPEVLAPLLTNRLQA